MNIQFLRQLQNLPLDAVFAVISDSNKECYISHTTNLRTRIGLILTDMDVLRDDSRLEILVTGITDFRYKQMYAQYYLDKFEDSGFTIIGNDKRSYINYEVKVVFSKLLDSALVVLVNRRKDKLVVGVFRYVDEANSFVDQYYKNEDMIQPIYSLNKETVKWCSTNKGI